MKKNSVAKLLLPKIYRVACHTDNVGSGTTYIAIKGEVSDGFTFIPLALKKGASKIVVENEVVLDEETASLIKQHNAELIRVPNTRLALAQLSAQAYNYPAHKLTIIGITGTKGKTTTSFLLEKVLREYGFITALTTTVHNTINGNTFPTSLTTCHPDYLHMFLHEAVKHGVEYVVMETAAQALSLHRLDGIEFDAALFTNFDQEHAEFYPSLEDYFEAKKLLFAQTKKDAPKIINGDDRLVRQLRHNEGISFYALYFDEQARYVGTVIHTQPSIYFSFIYQKKKYAVSSSLIGEFNIYNCMAVLAVCAELGLDLDRCVQSLATPPRIPGRLEEYHLPYNVRCYVDYAHTPSSYYSVLSTLKPLTRNLVVVFGCGGSRDPIKRSIMGEIASQYADQIILTSDNPRFEDPLAIINDIRSGIKDDAQQKVVVEIDRAQAIELACKNTAKDSIILILGKGPDHFQKIKGETFYFNDSEIVKQFAV